MRSMRRIIYTKNIADCCGSRQVLLTEMQRHKQEVTHGNRQRLKARKLDEMDLLALTIEQLNS